MMLTTAEAAQALHLTERAVRKALGEVRVPGAVFRHGPHGGEWLIPARHCTPEAWQALDRRRKPAGQVGDVS